MSAFGPGFIFLQSRNVERSAIMSSPIDGPFGRAFTFADPDGYQITLHDRS